MRTSPRVWLTPRSSWGGCLEQELLRVWPKKRAFLTVARGVRSKAEAVPSQLKQNPRFPFSFARVVYPSLNLSPGPPTFLRQNPFLLVPPSSKTLQIYRLNNFPKKNTIKTVDCGMVVLGPLRTPENHPNKHNQAKPKLYTPFFWLRLRLQATSKHGKSRTTHKNKRTEAAKHKQEGQRLAG